MTRLPATTVYYGLQVLSRMPTWVVMSVYLVQELHLSPLQLVLMGTAMEASVFLFEIPTGVVADTYSRRLSLVIGNLGMGIAWLFVGLVSAPWLIIALWAFWGFAYTFTSGCAGFAFRTPKLPRTKTRYTTRAAQTTIHTGEPKATMKPTTPARVASHQAHGLMFQRPIPATT